MGLGKNYEMAHQNLSEELLNHELWQERQAALENLATTGAYLASVAQMFAAAQLEGDIPQELWQAHTKAQVDNINATSWLIDVNRRITLEGL